jgi:hypothetical protein
MHSAHGPDLQTLFLCAILPSLALFCGLSASETDSGFCISSHVEREDVWVLQSERNFLEISKNFPVFIS